MNAIAYSLYGDNPKYLRGAVENAKLIRPMFPGWTMVIWCGKGVPEDAKQMLLDNGAIVEDGDATGIRNGMFWRFIVCNMEGVDRWLVRDCDSRLNPRDKWTVDDWIASGKSFHVVRDHPHHTKPIMGCSFGGIHDIVNMPEIMNAWGPQQDVYDEDQKLLATLVWPKIRGNCKQHDLCYWKEFGADRLVAELGDWRFIGEVYDEHNEPRSWDWQMRVNWMV